jgi:hypothetical protein
MERKYINNTSPSPSSKKGSLDGKYRLYYIATMRRNK